jgi:hypothetical protein
MLSGTGYPTDKILRVRVRVRVSTTRQVCTHCHLDLARMARQGQRESLPRQERVPVPSLFPLRARQGEGEREEGDDPVGPSHR